MTMTVTNIARRGTALLFLALAAVGANAWAQDPEAGENAAPGFDVVEEKIRTLAPSATTIAISETPVEGLLQAQINSDIVYISDDGGYLLQGTLFDIEARVNLTDQAMATVRKSLIQDIDETQQITFAPEEAPVHSLFVFTDIDCGYCRKLHEQMAEYNEKGIEIHYMAFPRAGVGSHSFDKYVSVWCAEDPQAALTLAKSGEEPAPLQCDNPVEEQFELGRQLGVTGTPAIVTRDGTLIPGYMQPEMLRARLDILAGEAAAP